VAGLADGRIGRVGGSLDSDWMTAVKAKLLPHFIVEV
jgi:hypothetical protein